MRKCDQESDKKKTKIIQKQQAKDKAGLIISLYIVIENLPCAKHSSRPQEYIINNTQLLPTQNLHSAMNHKQKLINK